MIRIKIRFKHILAVLFLMALFNVSQAEIAKDIAYTVINENEYKNYKYSIDVRLNKRISKNDLRSIAEDLKKLERKNYDRTFIAYYLPDMEIGSGAWATTHFNPKLKVIILGLTLEEESEIVQTAKNNSANVVGVWIDERPYVGATLTIRRKNGKLYLEIKYKDGSGSNNEMTEKVLNTEIKLVEKGGNSHGEYFILDKDTNLHAGGNNGIFHTYKKIK